MKERFKAAQNQLFCDNTRLTLGLIAESKL